MALVDQSTEGSVGLKSMDTSLGNKIFFIDIFDSIISILLHE